MSTAAPVSTITSTAITRTILAALRRPLAALARDITVYRVLAPATPTRRLQGPLLDAFRTAGGRRVVSLVVPGGAVEMVVSRRLSSRL